MKKIKLASLVIAMFMFGRASFAQKGVELNLKYNSEAGKYEVYAKSNFTKRNFLFGPSQITLVFPSLVSDEKLRIYNSDGGTWEDNTTVFSPKINPNTDYHAITTLGAKTDLLEGNAILLFSFSLPKEVSPSEVKLFENGKDPNSSAAGMKGGDFSNTINDALTEEFYLRNYKEIEKSNTTPTDNKKNLIELEDERLMLYPNTTKDDFKVTLNDVNDNDEITMIVSTETGRELMRITTTKKNLEEKSFKVPSEVSSQSLVVRVKTSKKVFGRKLILDRE